MASSFRWKVEASEFLMIYSSSVAPATFFFASENRGFEKYDAGVFAALRWPYTIGIFIPRKIKFRKLSMMLYCSSIIGFGGVDFVVKIS